MLIYICSVHIVLNALGSLCLITGEQKDLFATFSRTHFCLVHQSFCFHHRCLTLFLTSPLISGLLWKQKAKGNVSVSGDREKEEIRGKNQTLQTASPFLCMRCLRTWARCEKWRKSVVGSMLSVGIFHEFKPSRCGQCSLGKRAGAIPSTEQTQKGCSC